MPATYGILGPLEVQVDGRPARLGGVRQRAVLAVLLLHPGQVVPLGRLVDEVWPEAPPDTAANVVQGHVSSLRKELGREALETRDPGYLLRLAPGALDAERFERLAADGSASLADGHPQAARDALTAALALWRGPALADLAAAGLLQPVADRLDELRLLATERRLESELALGRHHEVGAELEDLVAAHPFRERLRALLMLALYRAGRQADALAAYRAGRQRLADELGLEPAAALQELELAILRQEPALAAPPGEAPATIAAPALAAPPAAVVAAALRPEAAPGLIALAEPLARHVAGDVVAAVTVAEASALPAASAALLGARDEAVARGVNVRAAAFTSLTPGLDLARLAAEQDAALLVVDAPEGLLEDARLLALLADAPCDVAVAVGRGEPAGPILVPFTGSEHDWAAVELAAWFARGLGARLELAGSTLGPGGRDASRMLANASLAVQRVLGVPAEPVLVEPSPAGLSAAAAAAGLVLVGLTDRWRHEGLGRMRTALASAPACPTLLVRRGLRPGGLASREADTRFTWSLAAGTPLLPSR